MNEEYAPPGADTALDLVLDDYSTLDTAVMQIIPPTTARAIGSITFAGPSHPKTIAQQQRNHDRNQYEARQLRLNPQYTPPDKTKEQQERENAEWLVDRIVDWDVKGRTAEGQVIAVPFAKATALRMMTDPTKAWLYMACLMFLGRIENFMPSSSPH
jgi:hypothetical protein